MYDRINRWAKIAFLIGVVCTTAVTAMAQSPEVLTFNGKLSKKTTGGPVDPGDYRITFRIYNALINGDELWLEIDTAAVVQGGHFTVLLGANNPLPLDLFDSGDRYLGMTVDPDVNEVIPRTRIAFVGNAFHANRADSSKHAAKADSSKHAANAAKADSSKHATRARKADTADYALRVADNSVGTLQIINSSIRFEDIDTNGAAVGDVMKWNGSAWEAQPDSTGSLWLESLPSIYYPGTGYVGIRTDSPNSHLHVAGSMARAIRTVSESTVLADSDCIVIVNTSGGDVTITLPTAVGIAGREYEIKNYPSVNSVVVTAQPTESIDGGPLFILQSFASFVSDGTKWLRIGGSH